MRSASSLIFDRQASARTAYAMWAWLFATLLLVGVSVAPAASAELPSACFLDTKEASGVSIIAFAVGQHIAAEICDRTYGLWSPPLGDIAAKIMANNSTTPHVAEFIGYAEQYAKRRRIDISVLFQEAGANLQHLRSQALTREYCVEFSRTLKRRLSLPDDIISAAVLDAALARGAGNICGQPP